MKRSHRFEKKKKKKVSGADLVSGVVMEMAGRVRSGSVVGRCGPLAGSKLSVRLKVRGGT